MEGCYCTPWAVSKDREKWKREDKKDTGGKGRWGGISGYTP
jgi:hypothetical protein